MGERGKFAWRLVFAVPAGLVVTLLVFAVMEHLASSARRAAFPIIRYDTECICLDPEPRPGRNLGRITLVASPPLQPPDAPEIDPEFSSLVEPQEIPNDPEALRRLIAQPDRPRNANWILLKGARPKYPPAALERGQSGYAIIEFVITEQGRTSDILIVEQSGADFGRAASRTVRDWLFIPRRENGEAVQSEKVRLRIEFRIQE